MPNQARLGSLLLSWLVKPSLAGYDPPGLVKYGFVERKLAGLLDVFRVTSYGVDQVGGFIVFAARQTLPPP